MPLVRAIVADLVGLSRNVIERQQRRGTPQRPGGTCPRAIRTTKSLCRSKSELEKDKLRAPGLRARAATIWVSSPRVATEGLVDFYAIIDGRSVYALLEAGRFPEVLHWHEREAGFAGTTAVNGTLQVARRATSLCLNLTCPDFLHGGDAMAVGLLALTTTPCEPPLAILLADRLPGSPPCNASDHTYNYRRLWLASVLTQLNLGARTPLNVR